MRKVRPGAIALLVAIAVAALAVACDDGEADNGADLAGTSWALASLAGASVVTDTQVTAEFIDGRIAGSAGCNSYGGDYEVDGSGITVGEDIAVTLRACEPAVMDQESAYLTALAAAPRFSVDGNELTVETGEGDLRFTLATT